MKDKNIDLFKMPRLRKGKFSVFFCADDAIATIVSHHKRNYEYMYLDSLYFEYNRTSECIGDGISVSNLFTDELLKYCGISMRFYDKTDNLINIVKSELGGGTPVFMIINAFFCPWDWRYHEIEDEGHAVIISDYDEEKNIFICMDPYYEKKSLELTADLFEEGTIKIAVFKKENDFKKAGTRTVLIKTIGDMINEDPHKSADKLAEDIKEDFKFENEVKSYDPNEEIDMGEISERVPLVKALTSISNNRQRYAVLMNYIADECGEYKKIAQQAKEKMIFFSESWDMVRYMLIKGILLNNTSIIKKYIPGKLKETVKQEKIFLNELFECVRHNSQINNVSSAGNCKVNIDETLPYGLNKVCNNEGIGSYDNDTADLNGKHEYFVSDNFPNLLKYKNVPFKFAGIEDGEKDNLVCLGQRLDVLPDKYKAFMLLGCSDFGCCYEIIKFTYDDESEEYSKIDIPDWQPELQYGEPEGTALIIKAVENCYGEKTVNEDGRRLYEREVSLNPNKKLIAVTLPQMPDIHIFAVTFGK